METISPDHQYPSKVISPPLTPFNITIASHQQILPPIKSLPTWNRTKLGIRRAAGPIPLNRNNKNPIKTEVKSQQFEQCTQTSRASTRQSSVSSVEAPTCKSPVEKNKLKSAYEKKIVFLQSNHEHMLTKLHNELEELKAENKDLNFHLVVARDNLERMKLESNLDKNESTVEVKLANRVKILEQELNEIKTELAKSKDSNKKLLETVQQNNASSFSHNTTLKRSSRLISNPSIHSHMKRNPSSRLKSSQLEESKSLELVNNVLSGTTNDDCSPRGGQLVHHHFTHRGDNEYALPKINSNKQFSNKASPRDKHEPIKLPVLQPFPFPNTNASVRRKRTKALQSQKYRSSKELGVYLAPK